ncbi:hypothetical protein [Kribbella shirazensis]|uniref:PH domain-containing protein n=1 Tax=Kribbella shirazensis TaxID=1105143 RepID=A0A7X6A3V6_9ACTN|nr:hypothetical protein [Kribbella shirazensis]NIK60303.1 hypothetical protein [Kribbella shirazensis]
MDEVGARRVSRWGRYGVALGIALVAVLGWWLWIRAGVDSGPESFVLVGTGIALVVSTLLVSNIGVRPRIRGRYLEVTTLIGRQSLDLSAVSAARWQRARGGSVSLRLSDDLTDVVLVMPVPPEVFPVIKDALSAAAARGVVLPRRVTTLFNLPAIPGAPRTGSNYLPVIVAVLAGGAVLGAVVGLISGR